MTNIAEERRYSIPIEAYSMIPRCLKPIGELEKGYMRDNLLVSVLTGLGACLPGITFKFDGDIFYTHQYTAIYGTPASGKQFYTRAVNKILRDINSYIFTKQDELTQETPRGQRAKLEYLQYGGDNTLASIVDVMSSSPHGLFINLAELGTLFSNSGGEYRAGMLEFLLCSASHDRYMKNKLENNYKVIIDYPKLALLGTTTPEDLTSLLVGKSSKRGLSSRFVYLKHGNFNEQNTTISAYGQEQNTDFYNHAESLAPKILNLWLELRGSVFQSVALPRNLGDELTAFLNSKNILDNFLPFKRRIIIALRRFMTVLAVIRTWEEQGHSLDGVTSFEVMRADLDFCKSLWKLLTLQADDALLFAGVKATRYKSSSILDYLGKEFTASEFKDIAVDRFNMGLTWTKKQLKNLQDRGRIKKTTRGFYSKL